jgi:hypothetical protein
MEKTVRRVDNVLKRGENDNIFALIADRICIRVAIV